MPLTAKGREILSAMTKTYGSEEEAKKIFYASRNAGKIAGVDEEQLDPNLVILIWKLLQKLDRTSQAHDSIAFDRPSSRAYDVDGRLHVNATNISKANVCPYYGHEIPGYQRLGLDPSRIYQLYRDPEELKKAAHTFDNLPLLIKHEAVTPDEYPADLIVGSTGTDGSFEYPYLKNTLVVWARDGIDAVQSGKRRELSCGYRYTPIMTSGITQDGIRYDGRMTEIKGNHVALVENGRAGRDVMVEDSGGMREFLKGKLSEDDYKTACDMMPPDKDCDKDDDEDKKNKKGKKVAQDQEEEEEGGEMNIHGISPPPGPAAKIAPTFQSREYKDAIAGGKGTSMSPVPPSARVHDEELIPKSAMDEAIKKATEGMITKQAMDEAISAAIKLTTDQVMKTQQEIFTAIKDVRPYVGELAKAFDSAEAVYGAALETLGLGEAIKDVHPSAYKAILKSQPSKAAKSAPIIAADASTIKSFAERYPDIAKIQVA